MSSQVHRGMMRCVVADCRRWWSVGPDDDHACACGGELEVVDMEEHKAALEYIPMKPDPKAKADA